MERTLRLIINPVASSMRGGTLLSAVERTLAGRGWIVERRLTRARGDGTVLAREAVADGSSLVVAAGGDGTINEVVNALVGSEVTLGVLPMGLSNVFALELGLSLNPLEAVRAVDEGVLRRIDLGEVNGRCFAQMVGVGIDGEAVAAMNPKIKRWIGVGAYLLGGIQAGFGYPSAPLKVIDNDTGEEFVTSSLIVGNGRFYGGTFTVTPDAANDDGLLDGCALRHDGLFSTLRVVARVMLNRHRGDRAVTLFRSRSLTILPVAGRPAVRYQVDGELAGLVPAEIRLRPGALQVLAAPGH
jgi:YegS/Rv2252/BmrU family lipid kinase